MGHLTREERGKIEYGLDKGMKVVEIALDLNRHPSTIYREINRNSMAQGKYGFYGPYPYRAMNAGNLAVIRRKASRKPSKINDKLIQIITACLENRWSPEQIANGISKVNVTARTIYNWIYTKVIPFDIKKLRRRGKNYKSKLTGKIVQRPESNWFSQHSIELRPTEVNQRLIFGHWEADSVLSGKNGSEAVASFVERKTRKYVTYKMAEKTSHCMYQAFKQLLKDFKGCIHSVTCDRGSEFTSPKYVALLEQKSVDIYMAHPYSPHERGSNENHNGLLREYFPKGTDFNLVSQDELNQATEAINQRPRKVLNWQTANQQFAIESSRFNV